MKLLLRIAKVIGVILLTVIVIGYIIKTNFITGDTQNWTPSMEIAQFSSMIWTAFLLLIIFVAAGLLFGRKDDFIQMFLVVAACIILIGIFFCALGILGFVIDTPGPDVEMFKRKALGQFIGLVFVGLVLAVHTSWHMHDLGYKTR